MSKVKAMNPKPAAKATLQVNMHEAKTRLSELVEQAIGGTVVVLARAGRPAVQLVPVDQAPLGTRPVGLGKGLTIGPDLRARLLAPLEAEEEALWSEGEVLPPKKKAKR